MATQMLHNPRRARLNSHEVPIGYDPSKAVLQLSVLSWPFRLWIDKFVNRLVAEGHLDHVVKHFGAEDSAVIGITIIVPAVPGAHNNIVCVGGRQYVVNEQYSERRPRSVPILFEERVDMPVRNLRTDGNQLL
jgi:hypothetical protein